MENETFLLRDLGILAEETRNNVETEFTKDDIILSNDFKKAFSKYVESTGSQVLFQSTTVVITNPSGQKIYAPNQWFVLAAYAVDLVREIVKYRNYTERLLDLNKDEFKKDDGTLCEKKDIYKSLKTDNPSRYEQVFKTSMEKMLVEEIEDADILKENVDLLYRFVSDDKWWYGGKGIERTNDFYVSPALGVLNLVNASQSYVATVTYAYANNDYLYNELDTMISDKEDGNDLSTIDENEYKIAAESLHQYVAESGFDVPDVRQTVDILYESFQQKFAPTVLLSVPDSVLLKTMFYTQEQTNDSLCYWLEFNSTSRQYCGSIAGGSSYKFGLFQKKEDGTWITGSPNKPQELTEEQALAVGKEIRQALVDGCKVIEEFSSLSLADYEQLDEKIKSTIGEKYWNLAWVHKYFSMMYPDKLSGFHSSEWQRHVLYALQIRPSDRYYARSGQIAMVQKYAHWTYAEFFAAFSDQFGDVKHFFRLGTSDSEKNYVDEWKQHHIVAVGWRGLGSLDDYVIANDINRKAVAEKLEEIYYQGDARTASRKAGEISTFYRSNSNAVFVAVDGYSLLGIVDDIGAYCYNPDSPMSNQKPGTWHDCFFEGEQLPNKNSGYMTSCYEIQADSDAENMLFLYKKYYYDLDQNEENSEERNKRLFRQWMETQVKPENDSNAGEPYSSASIDQYVSNIANTPLLNAADKSVFFTTDIETVKRTMEVLDNSEKKNNTQRSAIKKYMQYLVAIKEDCMPLVFNTNVDSKYERNRIVFGAPGTGKSYRLKDDCKDLLADTLGTYERVTFHPDYTYSQFVGAYKPVTDFDGKIRYDFVPGPFMRIYIEALKSGRTDSPQPFLLLIEEINRAKVAAVFGDVFQLLDRDEDGVSEYSIQASEDISKYLASELGGAASNYKKIRIPNNMFIWATMNSADQGVFPMDTAFKRRWNFEYLGINANEDKVSGSITLGTEVTQDVEWNNLRKAINEKLAKEYKVNEDKLMGPFFLSKKAIKNVSDTDTTIADPDRFMDTFKSKVIMYLYEDAAKQHKHKLFSGCEDTTKYSAVCESFDKIGMRIFGEDFEETYYNPQKG